MLMQHAPAAIGRMIFKKMAPTAALVAAVAAGSALAADLPTRYAAPTGMVALADTEMEAVAGQGLFLSDKIVGTNLLGGTNIHQAYHNPYTYYRMGLDAKLSLNMNIGKLQLGCGGVNDAINRYACDLDIDYVRLMGLNATNDAPAGYGVYTGTAGGDSTFQMVRPYLELAIKNDGNPALREVVGIKFGAESVTGALSTGRNYPNGAVNLENGFAGSTANDGDQPEPGPATNTCNTAAAHGNATLACDSGINSASGFLGVEISAKLGLLANITLLGLPILNLDAIACVGRIRTPPGHAGCGNPETVGDPTYLDASGTRFSALTLGSIPLRYSGAGIANLLEGIIDTLYAELYMDLRLLHHVAFVNSPDFFISFQRERVAYPSYSKQPLTNSVPAGNPQFDACGPAVAGGNGTAYTVPARCGSSYSLPANTGWWLNTPVVKFINVQASLNLGNVPVGDLLSALGPPGIQVDNPKFGLIAARNCYGSAHFC